MKTRKEFVAQFPNEIDVEKLQERGILTKIGTYFGIEAFQSLNKVIVLVDGKYFTRWN